MPVLTDFAFTLDPAQAVGRGNDRLSLLSDRPAWREMWESALTEARDLVRPAIAYSVCPVTGSDEQRLFISNGRALESAVVARLFAAAPEVVLALFAVRP